MSPSAFRRSFAQANSMRMPMLMSRVTARVLFVAGEKEPAQLRQWHRELFNVMRNAQAYIVPKQGHGGFLARNPELHLRMVRSWIEGTPLPGELIRNVSGQKAVPGPHAQRGVSKIGTPYRPSKGGFK